MLLGWILFALCFGNATREDTARLAQHLEGFRLNKAHDLSAAEYKAIQMQYLAWVDARMQGGVSVQETNGELQRANLLSSNSDDPGLSNVGFLREVSEVKASGSGDVIAIAIGVSTGGFCNLDQTVAIYSRKPLRRVTVINAEQSYSHGYFLRTLAVGSENPGSGRIIGSDWVATSCAGNWNNNILRIELSRGGSVRNVLQRDISVFGDEVAMTIEKNIVSFDYASGFRDVDILVRKGVAEYRVEPDRVVRLAPIAKSFGGFIDEWLNMDDSEAARWATPAASARHHQLVSRYKKERFTLENAADCPGPQPSRAIGVEGGTVFLVGGKSAAEMRMLSILDRIPSSCQVSKQSDPLSLLGEPRR